MQLVSTDLWINLAVLDRPGVELLNLLPKSRNGCDFAWIHPAIQQAWVPLGSRVGNFTFAIGPAFRS